MFQQLSKPVAVTFWRVEWSARFYDKQTVVVCVEIYFINHSTRNNQIISVFEIQISQHGTQFSGSTVDKNQLVGIGIFIKMILCFVGWCCQRNGYIAVGKHRLATF